jgi:hypothetical protein
MGWFFCYKEGTLVPMRTSLVLLLTLLSYLSVHSFNLRHATRARDYNLLKCSIDKEQMIIDTLVETCDTRWKVIVNTGPTNDPDDVQVLILLCFLRLCLY